MHTLKDVSDCRSTTLDTWTEDQLKVGPLFQLVWIVHCFT